MLIPNHHIYLIFTDHKRISQSLKPQKFFKTLKKRFKMCPITYNFGLYLKYGYNLVGLKLTGNKSHCKLFCFFRMKIKIYKIHHRNHKNQCANLRKSGLKSGNFKMLGCFNSHNIIIDLCPIQIQTKKNICCLEFSHSVFDY